MVTTLPEPTLGTGDIQFTLRWSSTADLDLAVLDPNGEEINYANRSSSTGGPVGRRLERPVLDRGVTNPVENVFWPAGESLDGLYTVAVTYFGGCGDATGPQAFRLTARIDGVEVTLTPQTLRRSCGRNAGDPR